MLHDVQRRGYCCSKGCSIAALFTRNRGADLAFAAGSLIPPFPELSLSYLQLWSLLATELHSSYSSLSSYAFWTKRSPSGALRDFRDREGCGRGIRTAPPSCRPW